MAAPACGQKVATPPAVQIALGQSEVTLTGPWKFHTGDNTAYAEPTFDDSAWESVDLTAAPGAHDADVGLRGYVAGWSARKHTGYYGYAWYRLRVAVTAPAGQGLALAGPPAVDSAYQVFVNGQLIGAVGKFGESSPTVYSIQPRVFDLPGGLNQPALIAIRVWMGPWNLADPSAGGMRIAPSLGETGSIEMLDQMQWLQTVRGYVLEVAEALAFLLLGVMAWTLRTVNPTGPASLWLVAALVLTALFRANQAAFFWGQFETVPGFELISVVLLIPLCLAAWTIAWRDWFRLDGAKWLPVLVALMTVLYIGAVLVASSWFYGVVSQQVVSISEVASTVIRIVFLVVNALIVIEAIRRGGGRAWLPILAVVLMSVGQFAQELSKVGVKGIWFPFGTGVSRTQYAYALFDVVLFVLLLQGFLSVRRGARVGLKEEEVV